MAELREVQACLRQIGASPGSGAVLEFWNSSRSLERVKLGIDLREVQACGRQITPPKCLAGSETNGNGALPTFLVVWYVSYTFMQKMKNHNLHRTF